MTTLPLRGEPVLCRVTRSRRTRSQTSTIAPVEAATQTFPENDCSLSRWRVGRSGGLDGIISPVLLATKDAAFALGIVLSPSSQLRLHGSPIGPGEVFLLLWIILVLADAAMRPGLHLTAALLRLVIFWMLFAAALSAGTITAAAIHDKHDQGLFVHDIMAYGLVAVVSCLCAAEFPTLPRVRRVAWLLVTLGAGSLMAQLADAWGLIPVTNGDPWYWERFRGWSQNPAQLAFLCAAMALLAVHLSDTATRGRERLIAPGFIALSIYVGRLTKTDAFTFVLLAAGAVFLVIKFRTWTGSPEARRKLRFGTACVITVALPLFLLSAVPLASSLTTDLGALAKGMSKNNGKEAGKEAALRLQLWREAFNRGLESGMLGLGPGPHLPIPAELVLGRATEAGAPKNIEHPTLNGSPNFEAHNTMFDLLAQGGLAAVLAFGWLIGCTLLSTYKARMNGLLVLAFGLVGFGMLDMVARYPLLWCAIALCLSAAHSARTPAQFERS